MASRRNFTTAVRWTLLLTVLVWLGFGLDQLLDGRLSFYYGLHPREETGLIGIGAMVFLHSGWPHLLSNTFPLVTLLGLLLFFYPRLWPRVLLTLWFGTGILVWILARPSIHIGASGLVFALAAFLGFSGFFAAIFGPL
ncbi:MAG: hypothetical protein HC821_02715 [Lewinella sp.]|nr:hypothetical protein [Lewinella sp.]